MLQPHDDKGLTLADPPVCTRVCTIEPENDHACPLIISEAGGNAKAGADRLDELAAAVAGLSAADRARLAAMLGGGE